jgi:hypothetical protein
MKTAAAIINGERVELEYDETTQQVVVTYEQGVPVGLRLVPLEAPQPAELAATLHARLTQIQQGRRAWLDQNIDPDGLQLAMLLYQAGDEKAAALYEWCVTLGVQSELRQSQLEAGLIEWDDALCDFSMYPKPHTNAEMMARAGLL